MPLASIRGPQVLLMAGTLLLGLLADVAAGMGAQLLIGAAFWGVMFHLSRRMIRREQQALVACLAVASAGEFFLSLGWKVYSYRLGNVPLFVPPGHVMMYLLAAVLARRLPEAAAWAAVGAFALHAVVAAAAGLDTFGLLLLLALGGAMIALPRERRLLASTMALSLALELYGTWLGTWTWGRDIPFTDLVTTNPPALSGALYTVRDALVAAAMSLLAGKAAGEPCLDRPRSLS